MEDANSLTNKEEKLILAGISLIIGTIINHSLRPIVETIFTYDAENTPIIIEEPNPTEVSHYMNNLSSNPTALKKIMHDSARDMISDVALLCTVGYGTHLVLKNVCGIDAYKSI